MIAGGRHNVGCVAVVVIFVIGKRGSGYSAVFVSVVLGWVAANTIAYVNLVKVTKPGLHIDVAVCRIGITLDYFLLAAIGLNAIKGGLLTGYVVIRAPAFKVHDFFIQNVGVVDCLAG